MKTGSSTVAYRHGHIAWGRTFKYLGAALFCTGLAQSAQASVLLYQDFEGGSVSYSPLTLSPATNDAINIRSASDPINTGAADGFDNFFGTDPNHFMVIGDNAGPIGGEPSSLGTGGIAVAQFDLGMFGVGPHTLTISFDYAFDTNLDPGPGGTDANQDFFFASLVDSSLNSIVDLIAFPGVVRDDPNAKGGFNQVVNFTLGSAGNVLLAFGLIQADPGSASAVGIDNVSAVPEPGVLALLGLGLLGLAFLRGERNPNPFPAPLPAAA